MLKSDPFEVTLVNKYQIMIPESASNIFLSKNHKRVSVKASFKTNVIKYHAALRPNKNGQCLMHFSQEKQKRIGIFLNDYFIIQLFEDDSKYGVEMPEELDAVFMSDIEAFNLFEALTAGRKRSIIYAIKRYKGVQTRVDKSLLLCDNLKRGITNPKLWFKPH